MSKNPYTLDNLNRDINLSADTAKIYALVRRGGVGWVAIMAGWEWIHEYTDAIVQNYDALYAKVPYELAEIIYDIIKEKHLQCFGGFYCHSKSVLIL